jgi:hypothetical protein
MAIKISRPVEAPVVEQEITLSLGSPVSVADLSWIVPLVLGGVNRIGVDGDKSKPPIIHPAGVKIQAVVLDGGAAGSVLSISVFKVESDGLTINADSSLPTSQLGTFEVNLDSALSNANVPRP